MLYEKTAPVEFKLYIPKQYLRKQKQQTPSSNVCRGAQWFRTIENRRRMDHYDTGI